MFWDQVEKHAAAIEADLTTIIADPASVDSFRKRHAGLIALFRDIIDNEERDIADILRPCPDLYDITAFQFSVFDNPKGQRWGGNLKAWTSEEVNFAKAPKWSANVALWPIADVDAKALSLADPKKRKRPLSSKTVEVLAVIVAGGEYDLVGLCNYKNPQDGTFYFEDHIVTAKMQDDRITSVEFYTPNIAFEFPPFEDKAAGWTDKQTKTIRKPLKKNAVLQSRHSFRDDMSPWVTGRGTDLRAPRDLYYNGSL